MKTINYPIRLSLHLALGATLAVVLAGCASRTKSVPVTLADVSGPARATLEKVTAGGRIDRIDKEVEKGKLVYDVEATVGGKHVEYLIDDADGVVLGTETSIEFGELPQPVRDAAQKYFGGATGLKAMKGVEYGQTSYEIEGLRKGKTVEVTFAPDGKRTE